METGSRDDDTGVVMLKAWPEAISQPKLSRGSCKPWEAVTMAWTAQGLGLGFLRP